MVLLLSFKYSLRCAPPATRETGAAQSRAPAQGPPRRAGSVPLPAAHSAARAGGRRRRRLRGGSELLPGLQIAPLPLGHLGQRHAAEADALDGHHPQAHGLAHGRNLPGPDALEREAQLGLALPAHLDGWQWAAVEAQAMAELLQTVVGDLALHLDDAFLLQRLDVLLQLARDALVLRVDHEAAGRRALRRQRRAPARPQSPRACAAAG